MVPETTPDPEREEDADLLGDSDDVDHSIEQRVDEQLQEERDEEEGSA